MECDVIPKSQQEVDPLGIVEHCNGLDDDSVLYSQSLSSKIFTSVDNVDGVPKNRKIINITPQKSRKLINIRSSTSPLVSHTKSVTDLNPNYGNVSIFILLKLVLCKSMTNLRLKLHFLFKNDVSS